MFSLVRNNVVPARRCVPVISFVVRPILRILVTKRRVFVIGGITTTYAFACVVFIPTNLCASCIFFTMMFKVVTECRDFFIGCIITIFIRARVVCFPSDFRTSRKFSVVMFKIVLKPRDFLIRSVFATFSFAGVIWLPTRFSASRFFPFVMLQIMSERRVFVISCITTTFALASIVFIPTNLCAGRLFSVVMFQIMPKCGNNGLCFQNCSAYRAMFSLRKSRGCACWINLIVYHFNVIACVFLPFHVNVNVFGQSRCLQGFKRSAYCQFSIEIVANDMISVFRYGRNIGGDIPNNIILSVVRVYGYFKT